MPTPSREGKKERDLFFFYLDAAGRTLVRVKHEDDGLSLIQHKGPNRHWRGGWPDGLQLPFRYPQLLSASPDRMVYVVHDEREAHLLGEDQREATVIRFPLAAAEQTDAWLDVFRGKRVLIIPQQSAEGLMQAARLTALLKDFATWVMDVELDGLDVGESLYDWLERRQFDLVQLDDFVYRQCDAREKANRPAVTFGAGRAAGGDGAELAEGGDDDDLSEGFEPMPLDALPPILARFAEAGAAALPCDPSLLALPGLVCCAGAIGNTRVCQIKASWPEPCILWSIGVVTPSSRKTAAFKLAKGPLEAIDLELARDAAVALEDYEVELQRWEASQRRTSKGGGMDNGEPRPKKPEGRKFIIGDITVETAVRDQRRNARGLTLLRDELSGWLASFGRYAASGAGQSEVACWTEAYEGGAYRYDRSSGDGVSIVIPRCAISIYGTIQPEVMQKCFPRALFDCGTAYRFMLFSPPKRRCRWNDHVIPPDVSADYAAVIRELANLDRHDVQKPSWQPRPVVFDPDAHKRWVQFHDQVEELIDSSQGDRERLLAKGKALCARLALVIHAVDQVVDERCPATIGAGHLDQAARLALWSVKESERVYSLIHADKEVLDQQRLVEWLRSRPGPVTVRDVFLSNKSAFKQPKNAELALQSLVKQNVGQWRDRPTTGKGGRPTVEFVLSRS